MFYNLIIFIIIIIGIKTMKDSRKENFEQDDLGLNILTKDLPNWNGQNSYLTNVSFADPPPKDENNIDNKVLSFSIKPRLDSQNIGFLFNYNNDAKMVPNESYNFTIYAKTDSIEGLQVQPYTADNEEAKDKVSRIWLNPQVVKGDEGWKKMTWNFKNNINSKSESISLKFIGNTNQSIRHSIFKPVLKIILKASISLRGSQKGCLFNNSTER